MLRLGVCESYNIILRNTPYNRKMDLEHLYESSNAKFDGTVLQVMYEQINRLRKIDFTMIDKSKGDVTKLSFYADVEKGIGMIGSGSIVEQAWNSLKQRTRVFTDAYKIGKDFVILTYQTLVTACLDALSYLIQSASTLADMTVKQGNKSMEVLVRYVDSIKKGTFDKAIKAIMDLQEDNKLVSTESFVTPAVVVGTALLSLLVVVPLIRELVFYFYYSRMRISMYLDQLHASIQVNETAIKGSGRSLQEKNEIIKKQRHWMDILRSISDKIRVIQVTGAKNAGSAMDAANKELNVDVIKAGMDKDNELLFG